jgi:diguanylate cyclase (GGDEF)-like protein
MSAEPVQGEERPAGERRRWMLAAGAILALGIAASVAGALLWRASVHARERDTFETAASDISGRLEMELRRDTDFVRSIRAVLTLQPNLTASGFNEWFSQLEDRQAQPAGFGAVVVRSVPAARLASFQAQRDADPAFRALVGGHVEPVAETGRARYCLLAAGSADISYSAELDAFMQGDWCDPDSLVGGYRRGETTRAQFTQEITDSGQFAAYSLGAGITSLVDSLILEAAVYRHGAPLATVAQRSAAVIGWVLGAFDLPALMQTALGGERGVAVTLYHENPGLRREFIGQIGTAAGAHRFTHEATLSVDGTWILGVGGAGLVGGPSAEIQGLVVFLGGILATLLLLALVVVLARSRERALAMVREKTGQLRHQALHDALTGLPNRVLALDRGEQMLYRARRRNLPVAALYVDVDGFKQVNDRFGHAAGDELLRTVAARLASVVREGDTAARLGGDEFVVLVEGSTLDAGPELVAERLLEVLGQPYELSNTTGGQLAVTASVGIAFGLRESADELLRDADIALYEAKAAGKNRYVTFQSAMQTHVQDRLTLQMDLADALERAELFLQYQPVLDPQTHDVAGVEALVRWRHPTRGVLVAAEFTPVAEESGLIVPIGRWALAEACRQTARWRERGHRLGISVSVTARQLDNDHLLEDVARALRESGLQPAALTLSVADAALMRATEENARRLERLKDLGVRIAIDGSLVYALMRLGRQLEIDVLRSRLEEDPLAPDPLDADEVEAFVRAHDERTRTQPPR